MRISQQIGWSQEAKLIYQLIKQTEKLNTLFPGNQPGFKIPISKPISLSNEANLYYEWLRELSKLTAHAADCCSPTTTTTTTTTCPCNTWELVGISGAQFQVTDCNGLPSVVIVGNGQMISTCCQNVLLISGEGTGTATNLHDCCPPGK